MALTKVIGDGLGSTNDLNVETAIPNIDIKDTGTAQASMDFLSNSDTKRATIGIERSAGGGLFVGSSAYAAVFGSASSGNTEFATNNNIRMTINSSGHVTILSGQLKVTDGTSDNADKKAHFTTTHYDTDEEDFGGLILQSSNGDNLVDVGGSQSGFNSATKIRFFTSANQNTVTGTERGRFDTSGNFLVGTSSTTPNPGVSLNPSGIVGIGNSSGNSGNSFIEFRRSATQIGSVTQSGTTGVAFNTSSDYRLKENIVTEWDATTRLKQLKPSRFNFKNEKDITVDGFIAHEVSSIVPEAINGEKDGTEKYIDDDGKEQTRPIYQGIDQSKLVPLLVKSLQEALAEIDTLKTKVAALEKA